MTIELKGGPPEVERVSNELLDGDPSIATVVLDDELVIAVDTLLDDQHLPDCHAIAPDPAPVGQTRRVTF